MSVNYIEDHLAQAKSRLIEQYKESTNLTSLIKAIILPVQDIEDGTQEIYSKRWLARAESILLDKIGVIVGEQRKYRSDNVYKAALYTKIALNRGAATPEDILNAIGSLYKPVSVKYSEPYAANFLLTIFTDSSLIGINALLQNIKPTAVSYNIIANATTNNIVLSEVTSQSGNLLEDDKDGTNNLLEDDEDGEEELLADSLNVTTQAENLSLGELHQATGEITGTGKFSEIIQNG